MRVPDLTSRSTASTAAGRPTASTRIPLERLIVVVLIGATLAALAVDQRLKDAPSVVRRVKLQSSFTPNGDGRRDIAGVRFMLTRPDVVTVTVRDAHGRRVRRLATARRVPANRKLRFYWDGRTDAGARAAPGAYYVRLVLARRGRTIDFVRHIRLSRRAARSTG
jgi:hypothetical protein